MHFFAKTEDRVLKILELVEAGKSVEDSRVELKRVWIDPEKAARRIAGHANASRGSDFLWIIGVDEKTGVTGADDQELASWWTAVTACFDGLAPVMHSFVVPWLGSAVCVLIFESSRAPYVVKNPNYGRPNGGSIAYEVPWRDGTMVRSATRQELIRTVVAEAAKPEIELLRGWGKIERASAQPVKPGGKFALRFGATLYVVPSSENRLIIPFHRCGARLLLGSVELPCKLNINITLPFRGFKGEFSLDTVTMQRTSSELIVKGPGRCEIIAEGHVDEMISDLHGNVISVAFFISIAGDAGDLEVTYRGTPTLNAAHDELTWSSGPES